MSPRSYLAYKELQETLIKILQKICKSKNCVFEKLEHLQEFAAHSNKQHQDIELGKILSTV